MGNNKGSQNQSVLLWIAYLVLIVTIHWMVISSFWKYAEAENNQKTSVCRSEFGDDYRSYCPYWGIRCACINNDSTSIKFYKGTKIEEGLLLRQGEQNGGNNLFNFI